MTYSQPEFSNQADSSWTRPGGKDSFMGTLESVASFRTAY